MTRKGFGSAFWFWIALLGAAIPAHAFDNLRFGLAGENRGLGQDILNASLLAAARRDGTTDPAEVLAAARADYARLIELLYDRGHFGPEISILIDGREAAGIEPLNAPGRIGEIYVRVIPGPAYRLGRAEIGPLAPGTELPEGYRSGAVAGTGVIREAALSAVEGWRAVGNAKATIGAQRITADHRARAVTSDLTVAPGPVLRFGDMRISGQQRTEERRIRKIADVPRGEVFDPRDLDAATERLRRTGTFRSVRVSEADTANADGTLDIEIEVAEEKRRRFGAGVELASDEGLTLSGFWLHRNLLGGAERLRFDFEIAGIAGDTGGVDTTVSAFARRPATGEASVDLLLEAEATLLNEPDFEQQGLSFGAALEKRLNEELTISGGVTVGLSEIEDATGITDYRHLFFPTRATLDRRETLLDTDDGLFFEVEAAPFLGLGGSESGLRLTGDARIYEDFRTDGQFVLAGRVQVGSIIGASLTGLPNDQRFYSGGGGTVRGQDYQSLDVPLGGGRSGGRAFLGASLEARVGVTDAISVVGFADWGHISRDGLPGIDGDSHSGAGLGLRYDTGIGPIRLDVAVPVSGPTESAEFHVYIGIGQSF